MTHANIPDDDYGPIAGERTEILFRSYGDWRAVAEHLARESAAREMDWNEVRLELALTVDHQAKMIRGLEDDLEWAWQEIEVLRLPEVK